MYSAFIFPVIAIGLFCCLKQYYYLLIRADIEIKIYCKNQLATSVVIKRHKSIIYEVLIVKAIMQTIGGGSFYEVGGLATDDQLFMHA